MTRKDLAKPGSNKPDVSIVMPSKNHGKYLRNTLQSIYSQKPDFAFETIVVDDGSTDDTAQVCKEFPVVYRYLTPTDRHWPPRPKNVGLRLAQGDIIIQQSDDVIHALPNCIETLAHELQHGEYVLANVLNYEEATGATREICSLTSCAWLFFLGAAWKEDIYAIGGYDEEFIWPGCEDDWHAACLVYGRRLNRRFVPALGLHQEHPRNFDLFKDGEPSRELYWKKHQAALADASLWRSAAGAWEWPPVAQEPEEATAIEEPAVSAPIVEEPTVRTAIVTVAVGDYLQSAEVLFRSLERYGNIPANVDRIILTDTEVSCKFAKCVVVPEDYSDVAITPKEDAYIERFRHAFLRMHLFNLPYDRIIYLDSDIMCVSDCSKLTDPLEYSVLPVYAALDTAAQTYYPAELNALGLDPSLIVNSGVFVYNRKLAPDFGSEWLAAIRNGTCESYDGADQGYLNCYVQRNRIPVGILPPGYNFVLDGHMPQVPDYTHKLVHFTSSQGNPWSYEYLEMPPMFNGYLRLWRNEWDDTFARPTKLQMAPVPNRRKVLAEVGAEKPDVSIVIATKNKAGYLRNTLASIYAQLPGFAFETIVVDDGSSDNTEEICAEYPVVYRKLKPIPYHCPPRPKNVALRLARGDIVIQQSDDVMHATTGSIAELAHELSEGEFVLATVYDYDAATRQMGNRCCGDETRDFLFFLGAAWRKDLYAVGGYDEAFLWPGCEDNWHSDCLLQGLKLKRRFVHVLGLHQNHPRNYTVDAKDMPGYPLYCRRWANARNNPKLWTAGGGAWPYEERT